MWVGKKAWSPMQLCCCKKPDIFSTIQLSILLNTVIFDMDGLLINSEPLWDEAAHEVMASYGVALKAADLAKAKGLRSRELLEQWFRLHGLNAEKVLAAEDQLMELAIHKLADKAAVMDGVDYIFDFFVQRKFNIGIASTSPKAMIEKVVDKLNAQAFVKAVASGQHLPMSKPHPQVYLNCAALLNSQPQQCLAFEDSFAGMIAAKAAGMKCVQVPSHDELQDARWAAADLKLSSLRNFTAIHLQLLDGV
jgi:mannitol-1-/sugar-/sorbitol-6-/2-deoxyglucose-6-phosphatase